jgi:hypothetical protein
MGMIIKVLDIQTGERRLVELTPLPTTPGQTIVVARMKGSELFAELDLSMPERGWAIFPN